MFLQDGFFDGELLDGRRGLVPSNFVEKLVGEDLVEFHQSVVMGLRDCDESMSTSVPQDLEYLSQDESQLMIGKFFFTELAYLLWIFYTYRRSLRFVQNSDWCLDVNIFMSGQQTTSPKVYLNRLKLLICCQFIKTIVLVNFFAISNSDCVFCGLSI